MTTAHQYAKALRSLVLENPHEGKLFLSSLRAALKTRGHEKLLPHIAHEYEKLELAKERSERAAAITPERERTRVLYELYKKLTSA